MGIPLTDMSVKSRPIDEQLRIINFQVQLRSNQDRIRKHKEFRRTSKPKQEKRQQAIKLKQKRTSPSFLGKVHSNICSLNYKRKLY